MNRRGDASERRIFAVVMAVVLGTVLTMVLSAPGDDTHTALAASMGTASRDGASTEVATASLPGPLLEQLLQSGAAPIRRELARQELALPELVDDRIAGWVNDLRDDGIRFNASRAMGRLVQLPAGDMPELVNALQAHDLQLRHLAAGVLRRRCENQRASLTEDLLQVSVDALRSDLGPVAKAAYATWVGPLTSSSARFLRHHAAAASEMLTNQLTSLDPQQRFLSAYLLAQAGLAKRQGQPSHAGRIAFELLGHLSDNNVDGDALMATHGLYRLGTSALPVLIDNQRFMDPQARKLINLIQLDLQQPPRNQRELRQRGRRHRISTIYHDAAIEYDMTRSIVPRIRAR